jgi:transposase-like protein
MIRDRKFWEQVMAAIEGGATREEAAKRFDVSRAAIQYWVSKFRSERQKKAPEILPVRLKGEEHGDIAIDVDGVAVRVPTSVPPEYVASLVRALRSC